MPSLTNILSTPLQIFEVAQVYFPLARAEEGSNGSLRLTLMLNEQPIILSSSVDGPSFVEEVACLAQDFQKAQLFGVNRSFDLDPSSFCLASSLSGWEFFRQMMRRIEYEAGGGSCLNLLLKFLEDPENTEIQRLIEFGLAPFQVEASLQEKNLHFFRTLFDKEGPGDNPLLRNFQIHYPLTFQHLLDELTQRLWNADQAQIDHLQGEFIARLQTRVIGQDAAVKLVSTKLATQQKKDTNGVFLFVGPSGVGKTILAEAVASLKNDRFLHYEMERYSSEGGKSTFFGPGVSYIGGQDKPLLAKDLDRFSPTLSPGNPGVLIVENVVLLFDELEKAHEEVKQSFLTLLDRGFFTVEYSVKEKGDYRNINLTYVLRRCIMIGTSNLFKDDIITAFKTGMDADRVEKLFRSRNADRPSARTYSPEFLNRFDAIVPFGPVLKGKQYKQVVDLELSKYKKHLQQIHGFREVEVDDLPSVLEVLQDKIYPNLERPLDEGTDLRGIKRYLEKFDVVIEDSKPKWKDLRSKKLIIYSNNHRLYIQLFQYVPQLNSYGKVSDPILLP